ncbi:MAG TPA: autotransporter strand-loop-strand O-heptosyltransferase [Caulobacteraceae bacterium]|jgi:autotransporter strand-loop-strand O-heptosyltransferase|nr:autotransporter strand-loop-strand O-heptosyltransferase [Caulobacteraceae bacterium]
MPTQAGPAGLRFDFNEGCRVLLPEGDWRVRFTDLASGNVLFDGRVAAGLVKSPKLYFIRYRIEVWRGDEPVLAHDYDAASKPVLVHVTGAVLGDTIGWFPYADRFAQDHGCRLTCAMAPHLSSLFAGAYPHIEFRPHGAIERDRYYATYHLGISFADDARVVLPCDFRLVGVHRAVGYGLGVDPTESPPRIAIEDQTRPAPEPYVCIAVQSTLQAKYWNHPGGWERVVRFLKDAGYRVICIDQRREYGLDSPLNRIPEGAEDETGDRPLPERARWLKHADFFVGLASGLSWLAWAVETPVVMISGFSHPLTEFATPYRVIDFNACNSCFNDPRLPFDRNDFLWCPRLGATPRRFECTRAITPAMVEKTIARVPAFAARA